MKKIICFGFLIISSISAFSVEEPLSSQENLSYYREFNTSVLNTTAAILIDPKVQAATIEIGNPKLVVKGNTSYYNFWTFAGIIVEGPELIGGGMSIYHMHFKKQQFSYITRSDGKIIQIDTPIKDKCILKINWDTHYNKANFVSDDHNCR